MEQKNAWTALFAQKPPTGIDFDDAEVSVEGQGEVDTSITLEPALQGRVDEFLMDPMEFMNANKEDPRIPQWTRLATALSVPAVAGAPVVATPSVPPSPGSTPLSGQTLPSRTVPAVPSTVSVPPTRRTLSASALMDASVGDGTPTAPVFGSGKTGGTSTESTDDSDDPPRRDKKKRKERARDDGENSGQEDPERPGRVHTPPVSRITRMVSADIINILRVETFKEHRGVILKLFVAIRSGDAIKAATAQKRLLAYEEKLLQIRRAMPTGYLVMSSAQLALDMIRNLRVGKDQSEPDWFQANYHSGRYLDQ